MLEQSQSGTQSLQDHTLDFQDMEWRDYTKHLAFTGDKNKAEILWSHTHRKKDVTQSNRNNHIDLSLETTGSNNSE